MQLEKQENDTFLNKFLILGAFFKRGQLNKEREERLALKEAKRLEQQRRKEEILQKQALRVQVDQLLDAQLYDTVISMMKSGYQLDKKQFQTMTDELDSVLENYHMTTDDKLSTIEKWLSKGWKINEAQTINLLFDDDFQRKYAKQIIAGKPLSNYPFLSEQMTSYLLNEEFSKRYFNSWLQRIELIEAIAANKAIKSIVFTVREHHSYLFRSIKDMNSFVKIAQSYSNILDRSANNFFTKINPDYLLQEKEFMNNLLVQYFPDGVNKLIDTTLQLFTHERIEQNVINEQKKNIYQSQKLEQLPSETHDVLQKIQQDHQYILSNRELLNSEQTFNIENFIEKKIPEILNKYLSMHPEYRDSFFNSENKTPKDLMQGSLINIHNYFQQVVKELNLDKMHTLSAMERYTGNFK